MNEPISHFFSSRNIVIALSVLLMAVVVWYFRDLVSYVLISWGLSLLGQPFMRLLRQRAKLGKRKLPDSLNALIVLCSIIFVVVGLVGIFVPMVVEQARQLYSIDIQTLTTALKEPLSQLNQWAHRFGLIQSQDDILVAAQNLASEWLRNLKISNFFSSALLTASNAAVGTISVMFITFFFLKDQTMFLSFVVSVFPSQHETSIREAVNDTTLLLGRYLGGLFLQMLFVGTFMTIAFLLLGIKNAILIAVFAALINIVPYLGPMLGCLFAISITISSSLELDFYTQTVPKIVTVSIIFGVMQLVNDWIVQPLIFSNRVLAHPLEIFLVTLIGAKLGGIIGMVLAIPSYTVLRVLAREFFNQYRFVQKLTKSLNESGVV
jgi:predicted PurR-regulated permease PerM